MSRLLSYANSARKSDGMPFKVLVSFSGALIFSMMAVGPRHWWPSCDRCSALGYVSSLADTAFILLAAALIAYGTWLTVLQMRQAQAVHRVIQSQSLLAAF